MISLGSSLVAFIRVIFMFHLWVRQLSYQMFSLLHRPFHICAFKKIHADVCVVFLADSNVTHTTM